MFSSFYLDAVQHVQYIHLFLTPQGLRFVLLEINAFHFGCVVPQGDYMLKSTQKHKNNVIFVFSCLVSLLFENKINSLQLWGECGGNGGGMEVYLIEPTVLQLCTSERSATEEEGKEHKYVVL